MVSAIMVAVSVLFVYLIISLDSALKRIGNLEEAVKFLSDEINKQEDKGNDLHA